MLLDCVVYCAFYSILFRGGGAFFPGHGDIIFIIFNNTARTGRHHALLVVDDGESVRVVSSISPYVRSTTLIIISW